MTFVTKLLVKLGILKEDLDYHFVRASMVIIYFFFGYQKWFDYEAQGLIPFFTHGPLIFWMYPVFGIKGSSYFLGVSEWLFGALLFAGFWNKRLGILGALLGQCLPLSRRSRSSPSCPMAGPHLQGDFLRWSEMSLS